MEDKKTTVEFRPIEFNIRTDEPCSFCSKGVMYKTDEEGIDTKKCNACHIAL